MLQWEILSNNLVYHDFILKYFLFLVEVKEDLEQMRKGIEELIDKSNISKTEEKQNEGRF